MVSTMTLLGVNEYNSSWWSQSPQFRANVWVAADGSVCWDPTWRLQCKGNKMGGLKHFTPIGPHHWYN